MLYCMDSFYFANFPCNCTVTHNAQQNNWPKLVKHHRDQRHDGLSREICGQLGMSREESEKTSTIASEKLPLKHWNYQPRKPLRVNPYIVV